MDSRQLRIVFMGTPDFAVASLEYLVDRGYRVVAVVTSSDKPAGRGLKVQESAVKRYALEKGLPVLQPEKLKSPEFVEQFRALDADLGIVIAFRMLPEVIWSMPRLGTFNLHASLLPQYRGAAPINWALINGEIETGLTTFMLNQEIDKGDILTRRTVPIDRQDTAGTLHDKLMNAGTELVAESVEMLASGNVHPLPQESIEPAELHPAPKIFKEDCRIDWSKNCETVHNLIRGLSPHPAAFSQMIRKTHRGCGGAAGSTGAGETESDATEFQVKIFEAACEHHGAKDLLSAVVGEILPGTVFSDNKTFLKVACGIGMLRIEELQTAGKKRMKTDEFLRGFKHVTDYRFI